MLVATDFRMLYNFAWDIIAEQVEFSRRNYENNHNIELQGKNLYNNFNFIISASHATISRKLNFSVETITDFLINNVRFSFKNSFKNS